MTVEDEGPFLREAAEWIATLHSGAVTEEERQACRRWRRADVRHERAYVRAESLWHRLEPVSGRHRPEAGPVLGKVLGPVRRNRRTSLLALAGLLGLGLAWWPLWSLNLTSDYHAAVLLLPPLPPEVCRSPVTMLHSPGVLQHAEGCRMLGACSEMFGRCSEFEKSAREI